jgi:hypothetical protein
LRLNFPFSTASIGGLLILKEQKKMGLYPANRILMRKVSN